MLHTKYTEVRGSSVYCCSHCWCLFVLGPCFGMQDFVSLHSHLRSSFAIISLWRTDLFALLLLSTWCHMAVIVICPFLRYRGLDCSVWLWHYLVTLSYFLANKFFHNKLINCDGKISTWAGLDWFAAKTTSEYDQEIQTHTADHLKNTNRTPTAKTIKVKQPALYSPSRWLEH